MATVVRKFYEIVWGFSQMKKWRVEWFSVVLVLGQQRFFEKGFSIWFNQDKEVSQTKTTRNGRWRSIGPCTAAQIGNKQHNWKVEEWRNMI